MFVDSQGNRYRIEKNNGYNGDYYITDDKNSIFRYIGKTSECVDKIKAMIKNGCVDESLEWPIAIVRDEYSNVTGVLYPARMFQRSLEDVMVEDRNNFSSFDFKNKIELARMICETVKRLHSKGVVIGNFNPQNIFLNDDESDILFTNTETFQYTFNGKTYLCNQFSELYHPTFYTERYGRHQWGDEEYHSEYVDAEFATSITDCFALSIIVFGFLMKGHHPYECMGSDSTVPRYHRKCIEKFMYCTFSPFFERRCYSAPYLSPVLDSIKPMVPIFENSFSKSDMTKWATCDMLIQGLDQLKNKLKKCSSGHYHFKDIRCPYCELQKKYESLMNEKQEMLNKKGSVRTLAEHKKLIHKEPSIPFEKCIDSSEFLNMSLYQRVRSIVKFYKIVEDDFLVRVYHQAIGKKRVSSQSRKVVLDCLHSDFPSVWINKHVVYAMDRGDIYNCDYYRNYSEIENQRYNFVSIVEYINKIIETLPNDKGAIMSVLYLEFNFEYWNKTMNAEIDSILSYLIFRNKIVYKNGKYEINPNEHLY